jgi:hypothetical protein
MLPGHVSAPPRVVSLAPHPVAAHRAPRSPGPACQPRAPVSPASRRPPLSRGNAAACAHRPGSDTGRLSYFSPRPGPLSLPSSTLHASPDFPPPSAAFPPPPFKRVSLPSPLAFLPSPRPTLPRTTPMCPRALPSSYRPPDTVRSTAIASPSSNSIVAPPCPPSPVRTAARTHPSTFLPFNSSPSPTPPSH